MLLQSLRKPRLILFLIVFGLVAWLAWHARGALSPFLIGLVVAYLLLPLVNRIQALMPARLKAHSAARPLAIVVVYGLGLLLLIGALSTVIPPLVGEAVSLYNRSDQLYQQGTNLVNEGLAQYEQQIPATIRERVAQQLATYDPASLLDPLFNGTRRAVGAISNTISFMIGLLVIPFWLFFILNDEGTVINGAMQLIPHDIRSDVEAVRIIVDRVLSAYIRGQLLVATALGTVITIGLLLLRVQFALLLGLVAGLLALVPFVGAILGAIPAIIVAWLQLPSLALWVVLLFVVVQQIDNIFFSPRIMGAAVALHPALIMVVIVAGSTLFGALGALLAVPLAAILRDVVHYFYIRVGDEPTTAAEALTRVGYGNNLTATMIEPAVTEVIALPGRPRPAAKRRS